ncbi:hypothetical protein EDS67_23320 [candidate division KSB1 bacterium]|nr:MAG: hypothetical protein EDS67_23320 [candidate division KSB1 bacterium]MBC6949948.1 hypothetical protein [candidate division KSB1 bacterium]MCE7942679.1 hypothetical protein [Chlorobi bacterium CHB1]MDL1874819.1 hypothetical protein [Cytophagia bacterium CHB2]
MALQAEFNKARITNTASKIKAFHESRFGKRLDVESRRRYQEYLERKQKCPDRATYQGISISANSITLHGSEQL